MKYNYQQSPLWDSNLSHQERLDYLLEELTLDEKLQCLGTGTPTLERLGMTGFYVGGEGAHGVQARHDQSFDAGEPIATTIFPNPIGMSATWDRDLIRQAGDVVGREARSIFDRQQGKGSLCLWAPTVDMERDPRWGRTEEGYGEDPYLAGEMASSYIRGITGEEKDGKIRCGATLKHFYGNNVEEGRVWKSSSIDPRNRYEYYLESFRRCAEEGGAESLMTAYNEVNGVPAILNREVASLAKEKWGIHHVVCDGGDMVQTVNDHQYFGSHTETVAEGLKAGIDCFTDELDIVMDSAREALELGMIQESDIDRALRCHFETLLRLGLFDLPRDTAFTGEELNQSKSQKLSREVSAESVVLLKNDRIEGSKILPLSTNADTSISSYKNPAGDKASPQRRYSLAVIGPLADNWFLDWYSGIPPYHVTPYRGICNVFEERGLSAGEHILYASGLSKIKLACGDKYFGLLEDGVTLGLVPAEKAEVFEPALWDQEQMTLRCVHNGLLLTARDGRDEKQNYRSGMVEASSREAFGWFVKEVFYLESKPGEERMGLEKILAEEREIILQSWNKGSLFVDEQNRIRVREEDGFVEDGTLERVVRYTGNDGVCREIHGEWSDQGLSGTLETVGGYQYRTLPEIYPIMVQDGIREAAQTASQADTVVFVGGAHPMITCKEEKDRKDIVFPPYQRSVIQQVFQANPKTVLALISSVPYAITWEQEHLPGILSMAGGGMELGNGLADVLFGKASPAGRLNMTWYRDTKQLPEMDDYDIIQGERTYQYFQGEVLYPFGYGLTYEETCLEQMRVQFIPESSLGEREKGEVLVTCVIAGEEQSHSYKKDSLQRENDFSQDSFSFPDEVVQLYYTKKNPAVKRPIRQLVGFQRIKALEPGESRELEFHVPLEDLRYYDTIRRTMLLEPGEYEFQLGKSSQNICLRDTILLDGTPRGERQGEHWQPADHYDRSANMYLWEGHMGYQSVVHQSNTDTTRDLFTENRDLWQNVNEVTGGEGRLEQEGLLLEYDNVRIPMDSSRLVLDMDWEGETDIRIYLDGEEIGECFLDSIPKWQRRHGAFFQPVSIDIAFVSIEDSEGEKATRTGTLRLQAKGNLKLCRWRFVAD